MGFFRLSPSSKYSETVKSCRNQHSNSLIPTIQSSALSNQLSYRFIHPHQMCVAECRSLQRTKVHSVIPYCLYKKRWAKGTARTHYHRSGGLNLHKGTSLTPLSKVVLDAAWGHSVLPIWSMEITNDGSKTLRPAFRSLGRAGTLSTKIFNVVKHIP